MQYAYRLTTHGQAALAACIALGKGLPITRVAFGSGLVQATQSLADVHALLQYETDGAIAMRAHEENRLLLTLQYAGDAHKTQPAFVLSEFMVYAQDPVSGEETDLLYGTLGDYAQPVPAYDAETPTCVFNFPLALVISAEISVTFEAEAGVVTAMDLTRALDAHKCDDTAHGKHVIATRPRAAGRPAYGLLTGGSGNDESGEPEGDGSETPGGGETGGTEAGQ